MKRTFLLALLAMFLSLKSFTQTRKNVLYFLADTVNVEFNNRILEIGTEGKILSYYSFFCKCMLPEGKQNLTFVYRNDTNENIASDRKPNVHFSSWQQLADIIGKVGISFDSKYDFYIVEVIPGRKYKMNKVTLVIPRELQN